MKKKKYIHYCWFGKSKKPKYVLDNIKNWQTLYPDYEILEWNENNFDITKYKFSLDAYNFSKWAFVSDIARLEALYLYGGIYLDTDVELLRKLEINENLVLGFENDFLVGTALICSNKDNQHIKNLLDIYKELEFNENLIDSYTGPKIITNYFGKMGLIQNNKYQVIENIEIYSKDVFYPLSYEGELQLSDQSMAIHYFKGSWTPLIRRVIMSLKRNGLSDLIKPLSIIKNNLIEMKVYYLINNFEKDGLFIILKDYINYNDLIILFLSYFMSVNDIARFYQINVEDVVNDLQIVREEITNIKNVVEFNDQHYILKSK